MTREEIEGLKPGDRIGVLHGCNKQGQPRADAQWEERILVDVFPPYEDPASHKRCVGYRYRLADDMPGFCRSGGPVREGDECVRVVTQKA